MPQQMWCAWLKGSPILSAYCTQYHCVTLAGHVADGKPTTNWVIGWLTEYPCKLIIWVWIWFGSIEIMILNEISELLWNQWIEFENMIYQMKKHLSKWIYSNQNFLTTCLTDTSVLYSTFLQILCFVFFSNNFIFRVNPHGISMEN